MIVLILAAALAGADLPSLAIPEPFAPTAASGLDVDAATFSPDGGTVFFDQLDGPNSTIVFARRTARGWSTPAKVTFSGVWSDRDPAMAPDGSFLIFVSNRPALPDGKALDLVRADGSIKPGQGAQLWRVDRDGGAWGQPMRLNDGVNDSARIYSPSVVADGSVYFQRPDPVSHTFHIVRSQLRDNHYQPPTAIMIGPTASDERDPSVAPDESFMVYSANYGPKGQPNRLYVVFRDQGNWGAPIDLGDGVNHDGAEGPHLGADARSVYFDSTAPTPNSAAGTSQIWRLDLSPWLVAHSRGRP
jgi:Tol biopolymer transport system component